MNAFQMKVDYGPGPYLAFILPGLRGHCPNLVFKPMVVISHCAT